MKYLKLFNESQNFLIEGLSDFFQELEDDYNFQIEIYPIRKGVNDIIIEGKIDISDHVPIIFNLVKRMENMSEFRLISLDANIIIGNNEIDKTQHSWVITPENLKERIDYLNKLRSSLPHYRVDRLRLIVIDGNN